MDLSIFLVESFSSLLLIRSATILKHQAFGWFVIAYVIKNKQTEKQEIRNYCTLTASNNKINYYSSIEHMKLGELLELATTNQLFQLNGRLYEHEGVAMGSSLGPLLANTFMCSV